jgi:hypothetical protein
MMGVMAQRWCEVLRKCMERKKEGYDRAGGLNDFTRVVKVMSDRGLTGRLFKTRKM